MAQRIAIFGGTFDPIHNGHIRLALTFLEQLRLDKVLLIPSSMPPHKLKSDMASAEHRLEMCRLATRRYPQIEVSDMEIRRGGASFTADTLQQVQQLYPHAQLYLLMGADMFLTVSTWNRFDRIAQSAILCVAPRDEIDVHRLRECAERLEKQGARCVVQPMPLYRASSTALRQQSELLQRETPSEVFAYIQENRLYTERQQRDLEEQYLQILQGRLTPKRYQHSLAVAKQAERLAPILGADVQKARTAGLLHDILKDTPPQTLLQMLRDFDILIEPAEQYAPQLLHAKAGAAFLEKILGISDADVLNAVRYHTTGRCGMSALETVVFLADFTSEDRQYPDADVMRRLATTDPSGALRYALAYTLWDLAKKRRMIHPDTVSFYNEMILKQLQTEQERNERDGKE